MIMTIVALDQPRLASYIAEALLDCTYVLEVDEDTTDDITHHSVTITIDMSKTGLLFNIMPYLQDMVYTIVYDKIDLANYVSTKLLA